MRDASDTATPHRDELPEYNAEAEWAIDDEGNRYKVVVNEFNAKTSFIHEKYVLTDEKRRQRDGVGEECEVCGEEIGPYAIPLNDVTGDETTHYHYGCFASDEHER